MRETTASYRIKDIDQEERPRERLEKAGAAVLSTAELLGILLRVGMAGENAVQVGYRLLCDLGGLTGIHRASFEELCAQRGVGPAKAAQIKAALELGKRLRDADPEEKPSIHSPKDVADLVQYEMSALEQESLRVILLDTRNKVLHVEEVYRGSLNSSMVRVGELFRAAIRRNCASILLTHNHPSGAPRSM